MKKILFISLFSLVVYTGFLYAENTWPELTEEQWENMTPEQIRGYIESGADIDARKEDGMTSLMIAARFSENPEVISVLLESGADGTLKSDEGKTAFDYAKDNEHLKDTKQYWQLNDARF